MDINSLQNAARHGDRTAENDLFQYLHARFRLFAQRKLRDREDAEEVVQDALKTVLEKYREIEFEISFAAWAYRVLENKILTFHRTRKRRQEHQEDLARRAGSSERDRSDGDLEVRLLECLRKLNEVNRRHARILVLKYQGFSVSEICERLGITRTNLYTLLSRARSLLELCLKKGDLKQ